MTIVHEFETKEKKDTETSTKKTKDKNGAKVQKKVPKPDEIEPLEILNAVPSFFIK